MNTILVHRLLADAVVETPGGAHFTSCAPDYGRDEQFQRTYVEAAGSADAWADFSGRYLDVGESEYQALVSSAVKSAVRP